ncbi:uncharacterized protein BJ171DRAFT_579911 [Polychytrium aggregatum]|uniref:uncharacterized protein n=1 Tax=Polychytrium aggregatum TaxID=110093 RepID=UPI0022FE01CE|nr:uncharacterized protein BJ171DRAFT_579911 [Polychytrium aggregatum]KAI9206412.1 hypothetical protein BJ171DRAFT_579911 [Polychytrium aggregatum]
MSPRDLPAGRKAARPASSKRTRPHSSRPRKRLAPSCSSADPGSAADGELRSDHSGTKHHSDPDEAESDTELADGGGQLMEADPALVRASQELPQDGDSASDPILESSACQGYQEQLAKVIETVLESDSHLMGPEQTQAINAYQSLSDDAKWLFIKMYNRTPKYERLSRLGLSEDCDRNAVVAELCGAAPSFATTQGPSSLLDWLGLLTKDELDGLARSRRIKTAQRAQDLRVALDRSIHSQSTLRNWISRATAKNAVTVTEAKAEIDADSPTHAEQRCIQEIQNITGPLIKLHDWARQLVNSLFIIHDRITVWPRDDKFMLNSILANLQIRARTFARYTVNRISLTWPTREDFELYVRYLKAERDLDENLHRCESTAQYSPLLSEWMVLYGEWQTLLKNQEHEHIIGTPWFQIFLPGWILTRVMGLGVELFRRLGRFKDLATLLSQLVNESRRGQWFTEYAKVLDYHLQDREAAYKVCLEALSDRYLNTGCEREIQRRLFKLHKSLKKSESLHLHYLENSPVRVVTRIAARRVFSQQSRKALYENNKGEHVTVEELAMEYFVDRGYKCIHAESSIITTLFGILFWDIIFDDSPIGVFISPYQGAPLDLTTEFFYPTRSSSIDSRVKLIRLDGARSLIETVDDRERPTKTVCRGVNWDSFTKQDLVEIAECIGSTPLSSLCLLFAQCYWAHSSGLPDLCVWNTENKSVRFVEVKGHGDRLSEQQKVWLDYLNSNEISGEEFHVDLVAKPSKQTQ